VGCGSNELEVWHLCQTLERQGLVILSDSIAADRGLALIKRLQRGKLGHRVLLLVQPGHRAPIQGLRQPRPLGAPLAMVHVESFGSGTAIRALVALRAGRSYLDPRLRELLQVAEVCKLSPRETQTLLGLGRGLSNKAIAVELGIKPEIVRDHVSVLLRKMGARNRTDAVGKDLAMGLIPNSIAS
jgi:DNA-binding NarL/FixJ family response regulator